MTYFNKVKTGNILLEKNPDINQTQLLELIYTNAADGLSQQSLHKSYINPFNIKTNIFAFPRIFALLNRSQKFMNMPKYRYL